jgi:hypothetical protein
LFWGIPLLLLAACFAVIVDSFIIGLGGYSKTLYPMMCVALALSQYTACWIVAVAAIAWPVASHWSDAIYMFTFTVSGFGVLVYGLRGWVLMGVMASALRGARAAAVFHQSSGARPDRT